MYNLKLKHNINPNNPKVITTIVVPSLNKL